MQGFFIVRDPREDALRLPAGKYEIPLMISDRLFTQDGQLFYPVSDHPDRPWVPEVFGNAILANGKLLPYHEVEPRKYRLRLMNGSNGRFYRFGLSNRGAFEVIANDQGLLEAPAGAKRLPLAPAERADIVVDFAPLAGTTVKLVSDSFDILEFRVAKAGAAETSAVPAGLHSPVGEVKEADALRTRRLTLDERVDDGDAAEQYAVACSGDREAGAQHDRDLGTGESDRRLASNPFASGAVSDSGPAAV
jgi:spore coat protein A